jgi:hypothetical protein
MAEGMAMHRSSRESTRQSAVSLLIYLLILLLPVALLFMASLAATGNMRTWLWGGSAAHLVLAGLMFRLVQDRPLTSPLALLPCLTALVWHWLSRPAYEEPFTCLAQGTLLLVPTCLFAVQTIMASGAPALQHARVVANRLTTRKDWPTDLIACRTLPDVRELREAIFEEAAPVLPFLQDPSPQVRLVVLAALEFRKTWRQGQPDLVLRLAQSDPEPAIRAAALLALGSVQQRVLTEGMAECLRDPSADVRHSAAESLLWDTDRRWIWIRQAVHEALADPRFAKDGALTVATGTFNPQAVVDLTAWATENGTLGIRATQTLVDHYSRQLSTQPDAMQVANLRDQVANSRAPAVLRVELASLLQKRGLLTEELLEQMLHPSNPSPLRLLAVEALLQQRRQDQAVSVLSDVARQPNRELALTAAVLVQKYLHVDMGLELGAPPPPLHSRQAAEVTHRIIQWAQASSSSSHASTAVTKAGIDW